MPEQFKNTSGEPKPSFWGWRNRRIVGKASGFVVQCFSGNTEARDNRKLVVLKRIK
jgi:hypothetical protein